MKIEDHPYFQETLDHEQDIPEAAPVERYEIMTYCRNCSCTSRFSFECGQAVRVIDLCCRTCKCEGYIVPCDDRRGRRKES